MNDKKIIAWSAQESPHYLTVLIREKWFIIIGSVVCLLLTAVTSLFLPNVYQASAILLVQPPKFSPGLRPTPLSVKTYQQLLLNMDIVSELLAELKKRYPEKFKNVTAVDLFASLEVEITKEGKKQGEERFSPLLILKAENRNKEISRATVDKWVELFMKLSKRISSAQATDQEKFISDQFKATKEKLDEAETNLKLFDDENNIQLMMKSVSIKTSVLEGLLIDLEHTKRALGEKTDEYSRVVEQLNAIEKDGRCIIYPSVTALKNTSDLNDFQKKFRADLLMKKELFIEMHNARLQFLAQHDIGFHKSVYNHYKSKILSQKAERSGIDLVLKVLELQLTEIRAEKAKVPMRDTLIKALPDTVLYGYLLRIPKPSGKELKNFMTEWHMITEIPNPVYQSLMRREIDTVISQYINTSKKTLLETEIKMNSIIMDNENQLINNLKHEWSMLMLEYDDAHGEFQRLERMYGGLITRKGKLLVEVQVEKAMVSSFQLRVDKLRTNIMDLNKGIHLATIQRKNHIRDVDRLETTFKTFMAKIDEARSAKAEETSDIKIAANPVKPDMKIKPRRSRIVIVAAFIGFLLSCLLALFIDFLERNREHIRSMRTAEDTTT